MAAAVGISGLNVVKLLLTLTKISQKVKAHVICQKCESKGHEAATAEKEKGFCCAGSP